jgi:hypothetical protein
MNKNSTIKQTIDVKGTGFITELKKSSTTMIKARSSKLSNDQVNTILKLMCNKYQLDDYTKAVAILALLFQGGGCAKGCDGNMSVTLFDSEIKLADLRKILQEAKCKRSERKLARSLADEIQAVSVELELEGNLTKKVERNNLKLTFNTDEKAWLSDFQADNPNCPSNLRVLINDTFQDKKKKK